MKAYKIWIEIEELDSNGDPTGNDLGILPDSLGRFKGKTAKRDALAHMADIVRQHGFDPENSDAVRIDNKRASKRFSLRKENGVWKEG